MEVFGSATVDSLDDAGPSPRPLYRAVPSAIGIRGLGTGYFSTGSRILQATQRPRCASKYKQVIGLEIFGCVTNLQLLFSIKLR